MDMKIVIQCAGKKHPGRQGSGLRRTSDNLPVKFVARPDLAPPSSSLAYARPDDLYDSTRTWRQALLDYNQGTRENPSRLAPAHELYAQSAYQALPRHFGVANVFILSAGWGLIPASFFTPDYDITFSAAANVAPYARRKKSQTDYKDFQLMPDDGDEIVFLGGKDYLPLFCDLTRKLKGRKTVFFSAQSEPALPLGFVAKRFATSRRTNWHYECAQALIDGKLGVID
jgi:hypothetical protein